MSRKSKGLSSPIPVRLTNFQADKLEKISNETGVPVSVLIRNSVQEYINK